MLSNLTRRQKRYFYLIFDWALVLVSLMAAQQMRSSDGTFFEQLVQGWPLLAFMGVAAPCVIVLCRLPWMKLAALDTSVLWRLALAALVLQVCAMGCDALLDHSISRAVPPVMALIFFALSVAGRAVAAAALADTARSGVARMPVAIYGAGVAGTQMVGMLKSSGQMTPVVLVDDNPSLHGLIISGLTVVSPARLRVMAEAGSVHRILLAMPSLSQGKQAQLLDTLADLPCDVRVLPSLTDMIATKGLALEPILPEALLGRDAVSLDVADIGRAYEGRSVMVTGAGGSIGSELCRQVLECRPARIVFFEQSEYALYQIDQELRGVAEAHGVAVCARLGSVTNAARVAEVLAEEQVDVVLHAAAYKHVPLVEDNVLEGANNNVIGTQIVAAAALEAGVERFILVSSDKAVRPSNIMGASKRMSEMVVQDMASRSGKTRFSMVRFGNVLGSSGSVLPLFQRQIRAGGPVTVTHAEVTRYFMTTCEAARLVLLAGAYSEGGDVFVLDMGEPMKIADLARRMIEMSGARVRTDMSADGCAGEGIEIKLTGLRAGEKLYEELLIDPDSMLGTPHPKILRAQESHLSQIEVAAMLRAIRSAISDNDADWFRATVRQYVAGYQRPMVEINHGRTPGAAAGLAQEKSA